MKTGISVPLLTIIMLTLSFRAKSQADPQTKPPSWAGISIGSTRKGVGPELMTEYSNIVSKYDTKDKEWWKNIEKNISPKDRERLEQIFKQMSKEQQAKEKVAFIKVPQPLKKVVPSNEQFDSWKNANVYGVWIDGKKVDNAILDKYKSTDFDQVTVSKLYGVAKQNKKYNYQVALMTKRYYQKYYELSEAKSGSKMVFRA